MRAIAYERFAGLMFSLSNCSYLLFVPSMHGERPDPNCFVTPTVSSVSVRFRRVGSFPELPVLV